MAKAYISFAFGLLTIFTGIFLIIIMFLPDVPAALQASAFIRFRTLWLIWALFTINNKRRATANSCPVWRFFFHGCFRNLYLWISYILPQPYKGSIISLPKFILWMNYAIDPHALWNHNILITLEVEINIPEICRLSVIWCQPVQSAKTGKPSFHNTFTLEMNQFFPLVLLPWKKR